ncbi:DUF1501 domain-containing protein [Paraglaciecola sp.]|uniref:DUF1501 domain-containing protein n=1 Tax=Paraglaciecola sp. TaxID=1920173 RepID=UPI003EF7A976
MLNRRQFIKFGASASLVSGVSSPFNVMAAQSAAPENFYVFFQVEGAWDVSSFCDPKINESDAEPINNWAVGKTAKDIGIAGNIPYAPWANNAKQFFDDYHQHMLVVNGVDSQTNSHNTGQIYNFSGRLAAGYPTVSALAAKAHGGDLPASYLSMGKYSETARLVRGNRLGSPSDLVNIINPNSAINAGSYFPDDDWLKIRNAHQARVARLNEAANLSPRQKFNRNLFQQAINNGEQLDALSDALSKTIDPSIDSSNSVRDQFYKKIDITLGCFLGGTSVSADISLKGFDTHSNHDARHKTRLEWLIAGITRLWEKAESVGIADKLNVVISSDFSRTPYYNSGNGKDHWPIGSAIFMKKNAPWGNRVVGATDATQNVIKINPATLQEDSSDSGIIIYPKDIIAASRQLFSVDPNDTIPFGLKENTILNLFDASAQTPQIYDPRNV